MSTYNPSEKRAKLAALKKMAGNDAGVKVGSQSSPVLKSISDKQRKALKQPTFFKKSK
jgi:hypothetical protein